MATEKFIDRHNGPRIEEIPFMLEKIGVSSVEELIYQTVPSSIRLKEPLKISSAFTERQYYRRIHDIAAKNKVFETYIGMGYYDTITPAVIHRNILENPSWYTSYTPYQAEISQGRLEALLNFQTMVTDLTAMELANASLLDEATAAAEAMIMMFNLRSRADAKAGKNILFVDDNIFPQTFEVIKTRSEPLNIEIQTGNFKECKLDENTFGCIIQYPAADGSIEDYKELVKCAHGKGSLVAVATDLMSLALLTPPGEWDADIVFGSSQRFGVPMGYGGPHAAFFATREKYKRTIPGRIIGITKDRQDNLALRMALQTREQHIKRERATSNICTAQALLAVMASMYAVYHGADGLKRIAQRAHRLTNLLVAGLKPLGIQPVNQSWFDTVTFNLPDETADAVYGRAQDAGINLCRGNGGLSISINEKTTRTHISKLLDAFAGGHEVENISHMDESIEPGFTSIPGSLQRQSDFLQHPVFNRYHSETEMLRYIKRLENKDLSLTHAMISLGSCTMKLNATSEMMPVTWPEFSDLHPFVPAELFANLPENPSVTFHATDYGGHMGYISKEKTSCRDHRWLDDVLLDWIESFSSPF